MTKVALDLLPVALESDHLRVVVLPELGGMIHEFTHKPSGRDLLFHHPRLRPRRPYYRAPVDDWWIGGVIEGLPTGFACSVGGQSLPDFGELWSEPWTVTAGTGLSTTLTCMTRISPLRMTRMMTLSDGAPSLRMQHRIDNLSDAPVQFIWGIHPTVPVGPQTVVQIPARLEEKATGGNVDAMSGPMPSPFLAGPVAYAKLAEPGQRFSYCSSLPPAGWFAIWDEQWNVGLGMTFSSADFPCLWLWVLDGWRAIRAITVEPWTAWPGYLDQAINLRRARTIPAGGSFETATSLIAFEPVGALRGFEADGRPIPA